MKKLFTSITLLFAIAMAAIAAPAFAQAVDSPPLQGYVVPRSYHNGPVVFKNIKQRTFIKIMLGGNVQSNSASSAEFYIITNSGLTDKTVGAPLVVRSTKAGVQFHDSRDGSTYSSFVVPSGESVMFSQGVNNSAIIETIYIGGDDLVAPPTASATVAGVVKVGKTLAIDAGGTLNVSPQGVPTGPINADNAQIKNLSVSNIASIRKTNEGFYVYGATASIGNAPTVLDTSASYLHLGGFEFGTGSYRMIGFGFKRAGDIAPVMVGYQETNSNNATAGDFVVSSRSSNSASTPHQIRLRVDNQGQVYGYKAPTTADSLTNKAYVDSAVKAAQATPVAPKLGPQPVRLVAHEEVILASTVEQGRMMSFGGDNFVATIDISAMPSGTFLYIPVVNRNVLPKTILKTSEDATAITTVTINVKDGANITPELVYPGTNILYVYK